MQLVPDKNMLSTFTLGSQQMFKVMFLRINARLKSLLPFIDGLINNGLTIREPDAVSTHRRHAYTCF